MIEDPFHNNLVLYGNGNGFALVCLAELKLKGRFEMEIEMTTGKRLLPSRTGEMMSMQL